MKYIPILLKVVLVGACVLFAAHIATAMADDCKPVAPIVAEADETFPDVVVTVYKGAEGARVVGVARTQSGRSLENADGATVLLSAEAESGVVLITEGECVKLAGRGPTAVIKAILEAAQVGGAT